MVRVETWTRSKSSFAVATIAIAVVVTSFALAWTHSPSSRTLSESIRRFRREGKQELAWKTTLELFGQKPSDLGSWKLIADMADEAGDPEIASTSLQKLVELDPAHAVSYWVRTASVEMTRNRAKAAESALDAALAKDPDSAGALRLKAQLIGVLGRSDELSQLLLRLIQVRAFTQGDLVVLASSDPFVADEQRIAALIAADPENHELLLPKARTAINENRIDEAKGLLHQLTAQRPQHWEGQGLLGQILTSEEEQFLTWQESLSIEADSNTQIWLARGLWLERRGETRSAARCFQEALKLEPELLMAISHLGQCVRLNGEQQIADQFSTRASLLLRVRDLATRIDEQHSLQWAPELIGCLEKLGQNWEAWAWSTLVLQANPINPGWKQQVQRLEKQLSQCVTRTDPAALPARHLDWSLVSLPDWSKFTQAATQLSVDASDASIEFRNDAAQSGLSFTYRNKVNSGESGNLIYESTGGGVAVIDVDSDLWPDLYFVQGGSLHDPWSTPISDSLFRNQRGLKFLDVTSDSTLVENSYGQGVAAGDINNDGFADLYVANIGENRLAINNGDGTFDLAPTETLPTEPRWTISTAIADLNNDGQPELVDVNYCEGRTPLTTVCVTEEQTPRACRPTIFEPAPDIQLTNNGDGTFIAAALTSDETSPGGRGMGVVVADFDDDKRVDMFVANDQSPNHLLLNLATREVLPAEFREEGLLRGVGLDREGFALAFMGIAHGDINRDGQLDLFVTTFSQETPTLFLSQPGGQFSDSTREAGLRAPCFSMLGFGTQLIDADNDGLLDLLILNGHIDQFTDSGQQYQMRPQCFSGLPESKFEELPSTSAGEFFATPRLGRALALLDWNKDHQLDFVATDLEQAAALGTNVSKSQGKAIRLRCVGVDSSRDAVATKVRFSVADSQQSILQITAGDGYEASSERTLHLALGSNDHAAKVSIEWSSGATSEFQNVSCLHALVAIEGRSIAYEIPL